MSDLNENEKKELTENAAPVEVTAPAEEVPSVETAPTKEAATAEKEASTQEAVPVEDEAKTAEHEPAVKLSMPSNEDTMAKIEDPDAEAVDVAAGKEDPFANVDFSKVELMPAKDIYVKSDEFGNFGTISHINEGNEEAAAEEAGHEITEEDLEMSPEEEAEAAAQAEAAAAEAEAAKEEKPDPMEGMGPEPEPFVEPVISDLYFDYTDRMDGIEENRYFRYLYEMFRAGDNKFEQTNQVLHKIVDETWLKTIEESLDALNRIIANPRKFIKTEEEIVPVGLAKKISADSVKHLSKNTQFIVSEPGEDVQPTKILNTSLEETYDLYENRFIYHLIQRLVTFIDKRTDVIFWSTGDEKRNKLVYTTQVDDAYETISYKLEMNIKYLTSYAENDADHMEVFARIDRLRRLVLSIKNSSFCQIMAGCAKVRSPIQRTNLMIKDPDYRTCYKLWHFLEDYDDVGYRIEVQEDAMAFDDEYVSQMYTGAVNSYAVFKSLMEEDDREISDGLIKRKELAIQNSEIVPKFVKEVQEVIVEDRNLPDVEIRRIFVEEVTQAQLDAEAHAEECEKAMLEAQAAQAEAEKTARIALQEKEEAINAANEAGKRMEEAEAKARESRERASAAETARRNTEERCKQEINEIRAEADLLVLKTEEEAQEYKAKADAAAQEYREQAEAEAQNRIDTFTKETEEKVAAFVEESNEKVEAAQKERDEAVAARALAEEKSEKARKAREEAENQARIKAEEASEANAEREFALKNLSKLENKVAVAERLKNSAENRAAQKVIALQSALNKTEKELADEKRLLKEKEANLEEAKRQLKEAEKEAARQKEEYEHQLQELKESKSIVKKWLKR